MLVGAIEAGAVRPVGGQDDVAFDARIIVTVKPGVEERVRDGTLREDLFLLVSEVRATLTPLDERPEDKGLLIDSFLASWGRGNRGG